MDGLKIEAAAGVLARDQVTKHFEQFSYAIVRDRLASQGVVAAYVDALAGALALTIQGRHGSKNDVIEATVKKLRESIERDLKHLKVI